MRADHHPIPHEALPPGWGPAVVDRDHLRYRRRQPKLELHARQTAPDQSHPGLGIGRCWRLEYCHHVGELPVTETIAHLPTKRAAIRGLLSAMHCIHEAVDQPDDPLSVQAALENVSLEHRLPESRL